MKEERLIGGRHRVCKECGETTVGSVIHYCQKDKIKIKPGEDDEKFDLEEPDYIRIRDLLSKGLIKINDKYLNKSKDCQDCIHCGACHNCIKGSKYITKDKPQFTEELWVSIKNMFYDGLKRKDNYEMSNDAWNFIEREAIRQGYILPTKSEEPLIVHNILSWRGKNYLKLPFSACSECSFFNTQVNCKISNDFHIDLKCENNIWKSFDDIQINDELACTRKDIGDIYITDATSCTTRLLSRNNDTIFRLKDENDKWLLMCSDINSIRLATAEELQEYFKENK